MRSLNKALLTLTALLILTGNLLAQPEAKIVGPKTAPPGEMVILSSTGSTGDNLVWVKPEGLQTLSVGCSLLDTQVVFATTKVGKYEFWLIVADKEARISHTKHVVEIKGNVQPPPVDPPPVDPEDPPPTDPAKWNNLIAISKASADKLNDATTRSKLKASIAATVLAIDGKCAAGQCPTLAEAKKLVLTSIESVLLLRIGASAQVDWSMWRKANQAELDRLTVVDLPDYLSSVKAIGSGL